MFWGLVTRGEWLQCIDIAVRRRKPEELYQSWQFIGLFPLQDCFGGQKTVLQNAKVLVDIGLYLGVLTCLFFTCTASAVCGEVRLFEQLYAKYCSSELGKKMEIMEMSKFFSTYFKKGIQEDPSGMFLNLCTGIFCVGKNNLFLVLSCTPLSYLVIYLAIYLITFFFLIVIDCCINWTANASWIGSSSYWIRGCL